MPKINVLILIVVILGLNFPLLSGTGSANRGEQKVVTARLLEEAIVIDGLLTEKAWQDESKGYSNFIQTDPVEGVSPTEKTVVWVAYDKNALYIAGRLYDSKPDKIIYRVVRRDQLVFSDWFFFCVDALYDRRTAYEFGINPGGSIVDSTIFNDQDFDRTWDGVWEGKAHIDDKGWTLEMKIPFDQLRFKRKKEQVWGINFYRVIKRKQETISFVRLPRDESGYVSLFARLEGIRDIKTGRFIEILPFTVGKATFSPLEEDDPFNKTEEYKANAGIDLKLALKTNLTLDLSVNPDFGQVEVDPAVINLSAAETYYAEKRPFFIEGADIFYFGRGGANRYEDSGWSPPAFFYSRRIGRAPRQFIFPETETVYMDSPDWVTILAAAKLSGKIGKGWNIGLINAITDREYAALDLNGVQSQMEIEPFSYYGILRVQKEFAKGRQGLGFISTALLRDFGTQDLEDMLAGKAFSFAVDGWSSLDKKAEWMVTGWLGGTTVSGSRDAIWALQHTYPHYFQRPDATHVELDENATSMNGWAGRFTINKQKGHLIFNAAIGAISPGFRSSDVGYMSGGDLIASHILGGYRWYIPGKIFRYAELKLLYQKRFDFGGTPIGRQGFALSGYGLFRNYWGSNFLLSITPAAWDNSLTRGGPLARFLARNWGYINLHSDNRKPLFFSMDFAYSGIEDGSYDWYIGPALNWKSSNNFSISIGPVYSDLNYRAFWVTNVEDESMTDTYGNRYIFAALRNKILLCDIRFNWSLNPRLSIQAFIEPLIAVATYRHFKELAHSKSYDFNVYGEGNSYLYYSAEDNNYYIDPDGLGPIPFFQFLNPDFNFKSLRGTVVLRWEYRPGSIIHLVWTQRREDYSNPGDFRFGRDFRDLFNAQGENIFMLKFTYQFKL